MSRELERVLACPSLPSLPTVAMELLELTRTDNVEFKEIEAVVQNDPGMASKILKTVNSSYYGLSQPCPTICRALTYLGLNTVKSLVLGFSLVDMTRRDGGFDLLRYWQRCIYCAAAARRLAGRTGLCDPEEAFVAALMQDIGMLAIDQAMPGRYAGALERAGADHDLLPSVERQILCFDHTEAGARLAEKWRLPDQIIHAIRSHHDQASAEWDDAVARIVAFSNEVYRAIVCEPAERPQVSRRVRDVLDLPPADLEEIVASVTGDTHELSEQFKVKVGELPDATELLLKAEDAFMAHQVHMQRHTDRLERSNQQLSHDVGTDGLTGIANRRRFDETMEDRFAEARASGRPLGLIMADADRFKVLNDTYGHQAGDAVLVELARRLIRVVGDQGIVTRYGGEEFAILLPGLARDTTARVAEHCRIDVSSAAVDLHAADAVVDSVDVTMSFGAAVLDDSNANVISTPELLVRAADRAMYAAKEAGRDCVRIFKLRSKRTAA